MVCVNISKPRGGTKTDRDQRDKAVGTIVRQDLQSHSTKQAHDPDIKAQHQTLPQMIREPKRQWSTIPSNHAHWRFSGIPSSIIEDRGGKWVSPSSSCSPIPLSPQRPSSPEHHSPPCLLLGGNPDSTEETITSPQITDCDVLCGRGAGTNTHPGNIRFRALVAHYQPSYMSSKALDKAEIAKGIVQQIRWSGGRFLKKRGNQKSTSSETRWFDIGDKHAREKTCQALREKIHSTVAMPTMWLPGQYPATATLHTGPMVYTPEALRTSPQYNEQLPTNDGTLVSNIASVDMRIVANDADVLLGRGGVTNSHIGNVNYRQLIRQHQREYLTAAKTQKSRIAQSIVDLVHSNGGRFLVDKGDGTWEEVSTTKAREKTSQALREKGPELRLVYVAAANLLGTTSETQQHERNKRGNGEVAGVSTTQTISGPGVDAERDNANQEKRGPLYKKQKLSRSVS